MKNRIISILLTITMVLTFIPFSVFAEELNNYTFEYDGYSVTYVISNSWANNQNINVTIINTGNETIRNWALQYEPCGTISGIWNGEVYDNNIVKNSYYNSDIDVGASISFGYTLTNANGVPNEFLLCSEQVEKQDGYTVDLDVKSSWDNDVTGFTGSITIANLTEKPIMAWELEFDTNFDITTPHNLNIVECQNKHYKINGSYNGNIPAYSSIELGINGSYEDAEAFPQITNVTMIESVIMISPKEDVIDNKSKEDTGEIGIAYFKETESWEDVDFTESGFYFVKNQILLTAYDYVSFMEIYKLTNSLNAEIVGYIELTNDYQIEFNDDMTKSDLDFMISNLTMNSLVEYVSLNIAFELQCDEDSYSGSASHAYVALKDEEKTEKNWHLYDAGIISAWGAYPKSKNVNVKIGLIDGNMSYNANSNVLFKKIWNIGEDDILPTYDTNKPMDNNNKNNLKSHGTHVAGIMAGIYNSTEKVGGVCPPNNDGEISNKNLRKLYGFSFSNSTDIRGVSNLMKYKYGLALLIGNNVKVINVSMGISEETKTETNISDGAENLKMFLQKLLNKGYDFVIISSAGNDGEDAVNNSFLNQIDPDSEAGQRIIVVGNMTKQKKIYLYSNNGNRVDVIASGMDIYSTVAGNQYTMASGTSQAAPIVAGIAAMIYTVNPSLNGAQVKKAIKNIDETAKVDPESEPIPGVENIVNAKNAIELGLKMSGNGSKQDEIFTTLMGTVKITAQGKSVSSEGKILNVYPCDDKGICEEENFETTVIDSEGGYEFVLKRGKYIVEINLGDKENPKLIRTSSPVDLTYQPNTEMSVFYKKFNVTTSTAIDSKNSEPLKDVQFKVDCNTEQSDVFYVTTDIDGLFTLDWDDGTYSITVTKDGYIPQILQVEVINGVVYYNENPLAYIELEPIEAFSFVISGSSYLLKSTGEMSNFIVNWGDGTETTITNNDISSLFHTYPSSGEWVISIYDYKSGYIKFAGDFQLVEVLTPFPENNKRADFNRTFDRCTNLKAIPEGLFDNNPSVTSFEYTFSYCTSLESIPSGIFDKNTKVTNFTGVFSSCSSLKSIPSGLFNNNPSVTNFDGAFVSCSSLESVPLGLFDKNTEVTNFCRLFLNCVSLKSIPAGLFDNNPSVMYIDTAFKSCSSLESIPIGLFDKFTKVISFNEVLSQCASLKSIPSGLFKKNINALYFYETFNNCSSLESIPSELFANNSETINFRSTFSSCTNLKSIPSGLFSNNPLVTNFDYTFNSCTSLQSIPSGLFKYNTAVTSFQSTFYNCTSLLEIPSGLFDNNRLVTHFGGVENSSGLHTGTFSNCTSLTSIPSGLFNYNTRVTSFRDTFGGCKSLLEIPAGLFNNNKAVIDFRGTFNSCISLTYIPDGLFNNNRNVIYFGTVTMIPSSYDGTFAGCNSLTGTAPTIWLTHSYASGKRCFLNCDKLLNYNDIPYSWK